jgi:hypothetical protein
MVILRRLREQWRTIRPVRSSPTEIASADALDQYWHCWIVLYALRLSPLGYSASYRPVSMRGEVTERTANSIDPQPRPTLERGLPVRPSAADTGL